jgi:dolichol-phosphate mannosyltransferase
VNGDAVQGRSELESGGGVLVVVPTYDERENLEPIVARVRASVPQAHVLVADDNSPDGTGRVADALAAADDHVHVLHRAGKAGLGAAYLAGFAWGLERGYAVLVEMDADGSHQPEQLPALLSRLADADVVLGSRWVRGGRVLNWPVHRKVISRGGTTYARLALGVRIRDITGGYRAFRADALRALDLQDVASQGYCFQIDLAWRAVQRGLRVVEVPITFVERERGQSKMSGAIVRESLVLVTTWGLRHRLGQLRALRGRSPAAERVGRA